MSFVENFVNKSTGNSAVMSGPESKSSLFDSKIKYRVLDLNSSGCNVQKSSRGKSLKKQKRLHKTPISTIRHCTYAEAMILNGLWKKYMDNLCHKCKNEQMFSERLLKADLHGSVLRVYQSASPGFVGLEGVLIQEKANSFLIVDSHDKIKVIPKMKNVFSIDCGKYKCNIYGQHFCVRSAERTAKKWKTKSTVDIMNT